MGLLASALAPLSRAAIYPRAVTHDAPPCDYSVTSAGLALHGWRINPGRDRALIYFGGNTEEVSWLRPHFSRWFAGHTSYLLAYRGFGASQGRPSQAGLTADALELHDRVAGDHPGRPVDILGRSLGTGVAMQLAARRRLGRLALVTPFDSLARTAADLVRLPVRRLVADTWDSVRVASQASANCEEVLVLRAGQDDIVRPARTDALLEALPAQTRVVSFPRAGHRSIHEDRGYWTALSDFFESPDRS